MNSKPNDFKLGLFVLGGLILLVAALFVFGASKWFSGKTVEETYVNGNVDGLKTGALVTLRGVPVGQVTRINFSWNIYHAKEPRYVVVVFEVDNRVALVQRGPRFAQQMDEEVAKGLRARVKSQGLAGATILALEYVNPSKYPPLPFPWRPKNIYIPSAPSPMSEIISSVNSTLTSVKQIEFQKIGAGVQQDLTAADRVLGQLAQADLGSLGTNANALISEVNGLGTNVNRLVNHLRELSTRVQTFVGAPPKSGQSLEQLTTQADQVLRELRSTVARLDRVAGNLDVASLNQTLENARQVTASLEEVVRRLKEYPAGMLFGRPPPPARGIQEPGSNK